MRKTISIILALLIFGSMLVIWFYAYLEPDTWIGEIYLKSIYDPTQDNLRNVSEHLEATNGGFIPSSFDDFLFKALSEAKKDSEEYRNILGFYAQQSSTSRSGSNIYERGGKYLASVIDYGKSASDERTQLGFLYLAYGIARKEQAYKPQFSSQDSVSKNFEYIEYGELDKVGVVSP